ncbi:hypothetical protein CPLU01_11720 [Colletotrichum plurivorum]|uniref:Uncharacterized protein n=1 Tax=Colletotrichum plurivorum TaxID=2175906 RepID=A0A8H6K0Y1_9PEZI|nr:hypothetical protein CPLU01_11720 [Colletotrichum plurivorum]
MIQSNMSVVPAQGILRKLYREAAHDIEYKSASFWHASLQRRFNEKDVYHITPDYSPDGTLRRVDACVLRYDEAHDTLSAMLWLEFKRPSGSVGQVESQALDAALRCITRDNLQYVYVMTTVGVSFRAWIVAADDRVLEPFHGGLPDGTRLQYINADSNDTQILQNFVFRIKNYPPLRIAPVVPSQAPPRKWIWTKWFWGVSRMGYQGQEMAPAIGEYGQTSAPGDDQLVEVHVSRIKQR